MYPSFKLSIFLDHLETQASNVDSLCLKTLYLLDIEQQVTLPPNPYS